MTRAAWLVATSAVLLAAACSDETVVVGRIARLDGGSEAGASGAIARDASFGGAGGAGGAACELVAPVHRYSFEGTATRITDSVAAADGELIGGTALDGSGMLSLDGEDDFVNLPNGLISAYQAVTLLLWVSRFGGAGYVRILDFGVGSIGEDPDGSELSVGTTYVGLTPATGFFPTNLAALISKSGAGGEIALPTSVVLDTTLHCVALAIDGGGSLSLYFDGLLLGRVPMDVELFEIDDVNNWLGRSQYSQDPYFWGTYEEFRIYSQVLSECTVHRLCELGPDRLVE